MHRGLFCDPLKPAEEFPLPQASFLYCQLEIGLPHSKDIHDDCAPALQLASRQVFFNSFFIKDEDRRAFGIVFFKVCFSLSIIWVLCCCADYILIIGHLFN